MDINLTLLVAAALSLIVALSGAAVMAGYLRSERQRLPAVVRLQELEMLLGVREARLGDVEASLNLREAQLLERDRVEAETGYWQSMIEALKAEYASLDDQRMEIEAAREDYRRAVEDLGVKESELRDATGQLMQARGELDGIREREDIIARREAELLGRVEEANQEIAARQEAAREELQKLVDEIETQRSTLQALIGQVDIRQDEFEHLQQQVTALTEKSAELMGVEKELASLVKQRDQLQRLVDSMDEKASTAEHLTSEVLQLRREAGELTQSIAEKKIEQTSYEARVALLAEQVEQLKRARSEEDGAPANDEGLLDDLRRVPSCLGEVKGAGVVPHLLSPLDVDTEEGALYNVQKYLEGQGLTFSTRTLHAFHTSLKTGVISPMTVLAGISGTGKSQLPRRYAEAMGIHFLKIPVQPRWDSPQDLFGFFNYIEKRYKATDLARALVHLDEYNWPDESAPFKERMLMVLLDEMNLARVEYYFAEFLSRLEGRPWYDRTGDDDERRPSEIDIDVRRTGKESHRVYPGHNILFVGTMNEDESTLALSDKVLDRSNVLRFPRPTDLQTAVPTGSAQPARGHLLRKRWFAWVRRFDDLDASHRSHATKFVNEVNDAMDRLRLPFGHRVSQAMLHYVANYPGTRNLQNVNKALADQIEQRILPKLRGVDAISNRKGLQELAELAGSRLGDVPLGDAIGRTIRESETASGMFAWRGFPREN